ncbi:hypothetical protein EV282_4067, partial [Fictibacillus sp. BK138]
NDNSERNLKFLSEERVLLSERVTNKRTRTVKNQLADMRVGRR